MAFTFKSPNLLPVLNGLVGDKLSQKNKTWIIEMNFRYAGKDASVHELDRKIRGRRVIVFVHGLMADERIWKEMVNYIKRDFYCLYVRYNTGLHISTNGRKLAELLNDLQRVHSPKELSLAGHSMGGLVIRSACYYGSLKGYAWTRNIRKIFLLAVPNDGAALEKVSHATSFILRKIAKFQLGLIGNILEQRSNGIKDLRLGSMLDDDWNGMKNSFLDHFKRAPVPALPRVIYYILVGSLLKEDRSFMAKYFGDGLVTHDSAISKTLMHVSEVKIFSGTGHNSLLKSKEVGVYLSEKLRKG